MEMKRRGFLLGAVAGACAIGAGADGARGARALPIYAMFRGCCTIRGCARVERRGERDAERPAVHPRRQNVSPLVRQFLFFSFLFTRIFPRVRRQFGIIVSVMLRQSFTDFIFATNTDGSGKAASYVRALDMLGPILTRHYPRPIIKGTMWQRFSLADIQAIHQWICAETKKGRCPSCKSMRFCAKVESVC